jgi:hypothetical protein
VVSQTFLNIVTNKENRGLAIQQGAVPSLISLFSSCSPQFSPLAGQALAKLTITTDPNIAFKGETASELVRPFVTLCNGENPLRQFEALMALTNLASMGSATRQVIISANGIKAMEILQFSENSMIQRAATEALCNMIYEVLKSIFITKTARGVHVVCVCLNRRQTTYIYRTLGFRRNRNATCCIRCTRYSLFPPEYMQVDAYGGW